MIKTYRKTATIQAEQFDGSAEMIKLYGIEVREEYFTVKDEDGFNDVDAWKDVYTLRTLEGDMELKAGDWIATGVKGEHWAIADDVFKASYVEVV